MPSKERAEVDFSATESVISNDGVENPDSRRDEILRRMLKTPPQPHKPVTGEAEAAPVSKGHE